METPAGPLLEQIRSAGAASAAATVQAARAEAERIRADAQEYAARHRAATLAAHERHATAALARIGAETTQRVGLATLTARAEALERVFTAAGRRLATLATHPALDELLARAIAEAITYLPAGKVTIRCAGAVAGRVPGALEAIGRAGDTVLTDERIPIGVVIESGDGTVAVNATFARRLEREWPRLATEFARRLAGGAP